MDEKNKKSPWFGPKRIGFGIGPRSWQGWLTSLLGVIVTIVTITVAHDKHSSWFKPKTHGSGFTPVTWQGWVATLAPIVIFLLVILTIYTKQRED
jgi:predicted membrane protein